MNVTKKLTDDENYRDAYNQRLLNLQRQGETFAQMTKKVVESAKKRQKEEQKKRKPGKDVVVSGATGKTDIRRYIGTLMSKISEIQSSSASDKSKSMQISVLQRKVADLEKILVQVEQQEQDKSAQNSKQKGKKKASSLILKKEDLMLNSKASALEGSLLELSEGVGTNIDMLADFYSVDIGSSVEQIVDVDL